MDDPYVKKASAYLSTLCGVEPSRRTGSAGNRSATEFFERTIRPWGYMIDSSPFACLDFQSKEPSLVCGGSSFETYVSPFSLGCDITSELVTVSTVEELEGYACEGKLLLMKGALCAEQLMPKNFVFYNPDHHKRIYALLEGKHPAAVITATGKNPEIAGSKYPFPLIEDGDFDIPSVYCTDVTGDEIATRTGQVCSLKIDARRIPTTACNVIARKNPGAARKIVVSAHIDAKDDAPGAVDNASGVVVQLLLAEMLKEYHGPLCLEIVAFNGEDYYSVGGQMDYLRRYAEEFDRIMLVVNIDGAGYFRGRTAYSLYECSDGIRQKARATLGNSAGIIEGEPWVQGDHMIFVQQGKAAIAITSESLSELMTSITHTPRDTPEVIDCHKLVEIASALRNFIAQLQGAENFDSHGGTV